MFKFKIGDRVKTTTDKVGVIVHMYNNENNECRYIVSLEDKIDEIALCDEEAIDCIYKEENKDNQVPTNRIERTNSVGTKNIIEYEIVDRNIEFSISQNPISLTPLLKVLLSVSGLETYVYKRVCPYKIKRIYKDVKHTFVLKYIDVKDEFKEQEKVLLELSGSGMKIEENHKYSIFIPDFLELCVERGILYKDRDTFELPITTKDILKECRYLPCKPSAYKLKKDGYIVPEAYKNLK